MAKKVTQVSKGLGTNSVGLATELSLVSKLLQKVIPKKIFASDWYERKVSLLLLKTFIAILDYSFREAADFVEMYPEADRFFDFPLGYSLHRLLNRKVYKHYLNLYD